MSESKGKSKSNGLAAYALLGLLVFSVSNHFIRLYYSDTALVGEHKIAGITVEVKQSMLESMEGFRSECGNLLSKITEYCPNSLETYCEQESIFCPDWLNRHCVGKEYCPSKIDTYCHQGIYGLKVALGLH